jgi:hypothetical protein
VRVASILRMPVAQVKATGIAGLILKVGLVAAQGAGLEPSMHSHFLSTKGKGLPVCESYLSRIQTLPDDAVPYCGLPEPGTAQEFEPLQRRYLSAAEIQPLFGIVQSFV